MNLFHAMAHTTTQRHGIHVLFHAVIFTGSSQEFCPGFCCSGCGAMGLSFAPRPWSRGVEPLG